MDSKTLFKKLIDYSFEQRRELKSLFSLISPEFHQETIDYLNFMNHENRMRIEKMIECLKKQITYNVLIHAHEEEKLLCEICYIEYGEEQSCGEGEYPAYGSHIETSNTYNRSGENVLIGKFQNTPFNIIFKSKKLFLGIEAVSLKARPEYILQEFLVIYLYENYSKIYDCTRNHKKVIDEEKLNEIKVQIPSLEKQKEILQNVKANKDLIVLLEQRIRENEKQVQRFLSESIIRLQNKE